MSPDDRDNWEGRGWQIAPPARRRDRIRLGTMVVLLVAALAWVYITRIWSEPLYAALESAYFAARETMDTKRGGTVDMSSVVAQYVPIGTDFEVARQRLEQADFQLVELPAEKLPNGVERQLGGSMTAKPTTPLAVRVHTVVLEFKDNKVSAIQAWSNIDAL